MADQTTTIPKGWKMTTLGEVGITVTGKTNPTLSTIVKLAHALKVSSDELLK